MINTMKTESTSTKSGPVSWGETLLDQRSWQPLNGLMFTARNRRLLFIIFILVTCVFTYYANGFLKTTIMIAWYSEKHGVHATLDEAIDDHIIRRKELYLKPQDVLIRKTRDQHFSFIWYVELKNRATLTDSNPKDNIWLPGKYFIISRNGWVEYPMRKLTSTTDLGFWMEFYHLYGVEHEQVQ